MSILRASHLPARFATGLFILNSGLSKRGLPDEAAAGLHGFASGTYPFLADLEPAKFVKYLSTSEIALGSALLIPFVPTAVVAAALGAFSAGLLGLYLKTPGMRNPGGIAPSEAGLPLSKDVFMLGIAGTLLADSLSPNS